MLNIVALQGRLVADPERRTTQSGVSVTSFTLAVQRNIKSGDEYPTDYIGCVAWRNTADFICKYFQKGQLMAVSGTLQTRSYEKDGVKRKATQVVVENANFCESRNKDHDTQHREPTASSALPATSPLSQDEMEEILGADDLPFD